MYEHVVEHLPLLLLYRSTASTAQSAPTNPQSKYMPIRAQRRKQADRVGEGQHVIEHLYNTLSSQKEKEIEICPSYELVPARNKTLHPRAFKK